MARLQRRAEMPPLPDAGEQDQHVILHHISWEQYVALADARGESAWPRLVYLEGDLEIMSPSQSHERFKRLIARLIEAYDEEREIGLFGFGSTTYRKRAREPKERRPAEPHRLASLCLAMAPNVCAVTGTSPARGSLISSLAPSPPFVNPL